MVEYDRTKSNDREELLDILQKAGKATFPHDAEPYRLRGFKVPAGATQAIEVNPRLFFFDVSGNVVGYWED